MKKAGLVDNPIRGRVKLSTRGREVLEHSRRTGGQVFSGNLDDHDSRQVLYSGSIDLFACPGKRRRR